MHLHSFIVYAMHNENSTMGNKKTHLADFETCIFRVYLRNHYKKVIFFIHILVTGHRNSSYLQKRCFARKK